MRSKDLIVPDGDSIEDEVEDEWGEDDEDEAQTWFKREGR